MESILAGTFCLLIGLVGLWTGLRALKIRAVLDHWPTTSGRVIERGTFKPDYASGPLAFRQAPLVKYVYQVAAIDFSNDRIHPKQIQQPRYNTEEWAQKKAQSFPDNVTVHYNPADPSEYFLVQTPRKMLYIVIGASSMAILYSAFFLLNNQALDHG